MLYLTWDSTGDYPADSSECSVNPTSQSAILCVKSLACTHEVKSETPDNIEHSSDVDSENVLCPKNQFDEIVRICKRKQTFEEVKCSVVPGKQLQFSPFLIVN